MILQNVKCWTNLYIRRGGRTLKNNRQVACHNSSIFMVKDQLTGMFFAALSYVYRLHKLIFKLLMDEEKNLLVAKILLTNKV